MFKIFLSHKADRDREAAREIKAALEDAGEGDVCVFLSSDIPASAEWLKEIQIALNSSQMMILLYTDPIENWDWCLWESGYFGSRIQNDPSLIFTCLAPAGVSAPPPLLTRQITKGIPAEINKFVEQLFLKTPLQLNPSLFTKEKSKKLERVNSQLYAAVGIRPEHADYPMTIQVEIVVHPEKKLSERSIRSSARFFSSDMRALAIFGLSEPGKRYTWKDIRVRLEHPELGIPGLTRALCDAALGAASPRLLPMFKPIEGGRVVRPMLGRKTALRGGGLRFNLILAEMPASFDTNDRSHKAKLFHLLSLCRTLDWKVVQENLEKFDKLGERTFPEQVESWIDDVAEDVTIWFAESAARGFHNFDAISEVLTWDNYFDCQMIVFKHFKPTYRKLRRAISTKKSHQVVELLKYLGVIGKFIATMAAKELSVQTKRNFTEGDLRILKAGVLRIR